MIAEVTATPTHTIESTETIAQRAITLGTRLQSWAAEASALELSAVTSPLSKDKLSRLAVLRSSIDSYEQVFQDVNELPTGTWITKALKAA